MRASRPEPPQERGKFKRTRSIVVEGSSSGKKKVPVAWPKLVPLEDSDGEPSTFCDGCDTTLPNLPVLTELLLLPACVTRGCTAAGAAVPDERDMLSCNKCGMRWQSRWWWDHLVAREDVLSGVASSSTPADERSTAAVSMTATTETLGASQSSTTSGPGDRSPCTVSSTSSSSASVIDGGSCDEEEEEADVPARLHGDIGGGAPT